MIRSRQKWSSSEYDALPFKKAVEREGVEFYKEEIIRYRLERTEEISTRLNTVEYAILFNFCDLTTPATQLSVPLPQHSAVHTPDLAECGLPVPSGAVSPS